jgi:hypothetical protein
VEEFPRYSWGMTADMTADMTAEEEVIALRAEVASLKEQLAQALALIAQLREELDKYKSEPPSFVKPTSNLIHPSPRIKPKSSHVASEPKSKTGPDVEIHLPKRSSTKWSSAPTANTLCNTLNLLCDVR